MNEIICPNCHKAFKVDKAGYADILKQVRDHQFDEELAKRLELAEKEKENAVKLAEANVKNALQEELAAKDTLLAELRAKNDAQLAKELAAKEMELSEMKAKISHAETQKRLEISEATKKIEQERDTLRHELQIKETEKELLEKSIQERFRTQLVVKDETIKMKDDEIDRLKNFKQKLST
ncbi:MAG: hypothetical protein B6D54_05715, partial [Epsilonproteobacteria bacterium 4484_65]